MWPMFVSTRLVQICSGSVIFTVDEKVAKKRAKVPYTNGKYQAIQLPYIYVLICTGHWKHQRYDFNYLKGLEYLTRAQTLSRLSGLFQDMALDFVITLLSFSTLLALSPYRSSPGFIFRYSLPF